MFRRAIFLFAVFAIAGSIVNWALACGSAWRSKGDYVRIADESAVIVWDAKAKLQHFIRRATFSTSEPDFGFLVPTPSRPILSEARDVAFSLLKGLMAPEIEYENRYTIRAPFGCGHAGVKSAAKVNVLEEKRVAGYDAAVLQADSATALNDWLLNHGYAYRPELSAWLDQYVRAGWIITAFKIAQDKDAKDRIATSAVRMTFSTEKPFFPYSEPADREPKTDSQSRLLRVFFIADGRYDGALKGKDSWPGKTVWAGPMPADKSKKVAGELGTELGDGQNWLTVFEDNSSPRPGAADVYFASSPSQELVRPAKRIVKMDYDITGWVCLGIAILFPVALVLRGALRKSTPSR